MIRTVVVTAVVLLAASTAAFAQQSSHWGIAAGVVPYWGMPNEAVRLLDGHILSGLDASVGLVRGRDDGGDWGIALMARRFGSKARREPSGRTCVEAPDGTEACGRGTFYSMDGALLFGVEARKFWPFVTGRRVQIGLNLAGGAAWIRGDAVEHREHLQISVDGGRLSVAVADTTRPTPLRTALYSNDIDLDVLPLAKVEGVLALRLAPGTKLRVGAGVNFPGVHAASVTLSHLFGAR